ncbi:hypothetical protein JKG47_03545 [Acidithiobacillus sp. MC6.1]|nr:hypothetical protein [Acidithiobacillus sp. MC6.1]
MNSGPRCRCRAVVIHPFARDTDRHAGRGCGRHGENSGLSVKRLSPVAMRYVRVDTADAMPPVEADDAVQRLQGVGKCLLAGSLPAGLLPAEFGFHIGLWKKVKSWHVGVILAGIGRQVSARLAPGRCRHDIWLNCLTNASMRYII